MTKALGQSVLCATAPEELQRLLAYWETLRQECDVPCKRHFDPSEIPELLPHIIMVKVLRDPRDGVFEDFQFRIIGDYVDKHMRARYTGQKLSQIDGKGPGTDLWETYSSVERSGQPTAISLNYIGPMDTVKTSSEVFLPLTVNGQQVDFIISGLVFS